MVAIDSRNNTRNNWAVSSLESFAPIGSERCHNIKTGTPPRQYVDDLVDAHALAERALAGILNDEKIIVDAKELLPGVHEGHGDTEFEVDGALVLKILVTQIPELANSEVLREHYRASNVATPELEAIFGPKNPSIVRFVTRNRGPLAVLSTATLGTAVLLTNSAADEQEPSAFEPPPIQMMIKLKPESSLSAQDRVSVGSVDSRASSGVQLPPPQMMLKRAPGFSYESQTNGAPDDRTRFPDIAFPPKG